MKKFTNTTPQKFIGILALGLVPLLSGCLSGEPSAADVEGVMRADKVNFNQVNGVRKIGCVQATNAPGYVCDVEIDAVVKMFGKESFKTMAKFRFFKDEGAWKAVPV